MANRQKYRMGEMTRTEMREILSCDPVVLIPMGSLEDQGPQTFMGDYLCAERLAVAASEQAGAREVEMIVSPVVPFGCADCFGSVLGGITLTSNTFRLVIEELIACLMESGARRFIIINGHGGNVDGIFDVTNAVYRKTGIIIPSLYVWKVAYEMFSEWMGAEKALASAGHGANPLSSVAMHMFPEFMRPDLAEPPKPLGKVLGMQSLGYGTALLNGYEVNVPIFVKDVSENGVVTGDMRACTPEIGATLANRIIDMILELSRCVPKTSDSR